MPTVIPVKFKYAARDLWFDPMDTGAVEADHVICSTERGTEIGIVTADAHEVTDDELHSMIGEATLKGVLRVATDEDLDRADALAERGDEAMPTFRRLVSESGLDMKPIGVEYLFGGEKAVCYFTAEERVDFRQLVRDMARELHERIDMRQIGVREEAAIVGGFAHCGQELCCARFGHQFEPVSIRMAKEQDLPLNSTKISGACGRLMCCLRYEFEAYRDFKGRAPKRNAVIETPLGKGKIIEYDTPKEQLTLRLENGKQVRVALADMEASEAAVKKSQELNCPCRPDTAPRTALERLATPEVQLALAELDREMGVVSDEAPDQSDLFVEVSRSRRRRRTEPVDMPAEEQAAPTPAEGATSSRTRRRRKKRASEGAADVVAAPATTSVDTEPPSRTTRTPRRSETTEASTASESTQPKTSRRRRHHAAEGTAPAVSSAAEQAQPKASRQQRRRRTTEPRQQQEAPRTNEHQPTRRQRRRPGDRGGQVAQNAAQQASQSRQAQQANQAQPKATDAGDGSAPKRKRRHRGNRGRGRGAGEGQQQAPSAE